MIRFCYANGRLNLHLGFGTPICTGLSAPRNPIFSQCQVSIWSLIRGHLCRTIPAGYLEVGESAMEGATRETLEEACADVEVTSPFAQLDIPRIGHVGKTLSLSLSHPRRCIKTELPLMS